MKILIVGVEIAHLTLQLYKWVHETFKRTMSAKIQVKHGDICWSDDTKESPETSFASVGEPFLLKYGQSWLL